MKHHLHDVVRLTKPLSGHGIEPGARGTVVMVFTNPDAYEVELCDDDGKTLLLTTLTEEWLVADDQAHAPGANGTDGSQPSST